MTSAPVVGDEPVSTGNQGVAPVADESPLEIVESGWSVSSGGYINYAFALRNNSDSVQVDFPRVTITGRSEDGAVVFAEDQVLDVIYPGQTIWWGFSAGNGNPPDSVEFAVTEPNDQDMSEAIGEPARFSVSNVSVVDSGYGMKSFTGEVTMDSEGDERIGMDSVAVVVVLRNEAGQVIYGNLSFVDGPAVGVSRSFEVSCYDPPEYATYEVHAKAW